MLTGNELPPDIVYFGKCLMGETSISGFKETLQQSARNAELYLDVSFAPKNAHSSLTLSHFTSFIQCAQIGRIQ